MTKYSSFGAALAIGSGLIATTPTYVTIAQVSNVAGPSMALDTVDVTTHDSAGGFREFVAGLADAGEVTFDLVYDPDSATHANSSGGVVYRLHQRTATAFKLTLTDTTATVITFDAFVTAFEPSEPVDGAMTASLTLKITGQLTWA